MMGAANVVFTALLSKTLLGNVMAKHEAFGVGVLVVGLLVVGSARVASVSGQDDGTSEGLPAWAPPLGLLMVLLANLFYALEFISARLLGESGASAFMSVGVMGLWGVLMFAVLFPVLAATPRAPEAWAPAVHEELGSSLALVAARPALAAEIAGLWAMLLIFNAAAFKTTEHLSALTRVVLGQLVSPLVWLLDVALSRLVGGGAAERWTSWSFLQLLGFALLVAGSAVYNDAAPRCCATGGCPPARSAAGVSLVEAASAGG
ncbi:unnamed protein product [Prorocentrum cordatum]|uniref:EamA domain-containing protein n=1 Tax=Prorocentrum cordatum TaxID=2364126 RepID=A0ABN9RK00_9DINO|nr:unnamed protein product [Polarella glacialis]